MIDLKEYIFNKDNYNDIIVIEGSECYMLVIQINSNDEIDYTIYDGYGNDLDGGIITDLVVQYGELFRFISIDKFNETSRILKSDEKENYLEGLY